MDVMYREFRGRLDKTLRTALQREIELLASGGWSFEKDPATVGAEAMRMLGRIAMLQEIMSLPQDIEDQILKQ